MTGKENKGMKMSQQPDQDDHANTQGNCDKCGETIYRFRGQGDVYCDCGANYNCFGQRLRDDLRTRINESEYDDDIGDLEGDELSYIRQEAVREAEYASEQYWDNKP